MKMKKESNIKPITKFSFWVGIILFLVVVNIYFGYLRYFTAVILIPIAYCTLSNRIGVFARLSLAVMAAAIWVQVITPWMGRNLPSTSQSNTKVSADLFLARLLHQPGAEQERALFDLGKELGEIQAKELDSASTQLLTNYKNDVISQDSLKQNVDNLVQKVNENKQLLHNLENPPESSAIKDKAPDQISKVDTLIVSANHPFPDSVMTPKGPCRFSVNDEDIHRPQGCWLDNSGFFTVYVFHQPDGTLRIEAKGEVVWINYRGLEKKCGPEGTPWKKLPSNYRFDFSPENYICRYAFPGALVADWNGQRFPVGKSKVIG